MISQESFDLSSCQLIAAGNLHSSAVILSTIDNPIEGVSNTCSSRSAARITIISLQWLKLAPRCSRREATLPASGISHSCIPKGEKAECMNPAFRKALLSQLGSSTNRFWHEINKARASETAMPQLSPYSYLSSTPMGASSYLWPVLLREINKLGLTDKRAFDLGCGNGSMANMLHGCGFEVWGVDPSSSGVAIAVEQFPHLHIECGSADDNLRERYGTFPLVVSLEVIAHCYSASAFAKACFELLCPGGAVILSAPYHGYSKNLALSVLNAWDVHHRSLGDGEWIKFFSINTLRELLLGTGFIDFRCFRVGRIPLLAKSMIAVARRPAE